MKWAVLRLITPNAETGAQLLLDAGCNGVQIDDSAVLIDESEDATEDATIVAKPEAVISGYFDSERDLDAARCRVQQAIAGTKSRLAVESLAGKDWANAWRENFPPLHIGPFWIVPPWEEVPAAAAGATVIWIDPGLAFGTGQHPTTRLCLELLASHWSGCVGRGETPHLLDVGCGSGVLSIAAALLGARVTASDLDPFCVQATKDNAVLNGAAVNVVQAAGLDWVATKYTVVVANLMSALLVNLAPGLAGATRAGGTLIVSGISAPRADEVQAALHAAGFTAVERRDLDGEQRGDFTERWTAFAMRNEA